MEEGGGGREGREGEGGEGGRGVDREETVEERKTWMTREHRREVVSFSGTLSPHMSGWQLQ